MGAYTSSSSKVYVALLLSASARPNSSAEMVPTATRSGLLGPASPSYWRYRTNSTSGYASPASRPSNSFFTVSEPLVAS